MDYRVKIFAALLFVSFTLASCGGSKDTTNTIPTPNDPSSEPGQPLPQPTPATDSRLPDWIQKAAPLKLTQTGIYTQLESLVLNPNERLVLPVVGDPIIAMSLEGGRSTQVKGDLFIGVEDKQGFAYRQWSSIEP